LLLFLFVASLCSSSCSRFVALLTYGLSCGGCVNQTRIVNCIGGMHHPIRLGKTRISPFVLLIKLFE
jgi:hypothetical protein